MSRRTTLALIMAGLVLVLAVLFLVVPRIQESLAPLPQRAWLGIEVGGSGVAEVGPVSIAAGTPFRLHAILEAKARDGSTIYLTDIGKVRIGGTTVEAPVVRPYRLSGDARLLWFTVEGNVPYLVLDEGQGADRFRMQEFFHPEWGRTWSVEGSLVSHHDAQLASLGSLVEHRSFGSQSFQVWIEIFPPEGGAVPDKRFKSPGVEQLREQPETFATVVSRLAGRVGPASAVFGLTQIEPPPAPSEELLEALTGLADRGLAFTRLTLLRDHLRAAGRAPDDLVWRRIDLESGPTWGENGAAPGDLLRVGARVVVLVRDEGRPSVLDPRDLCFDYEQGATMRPLDAVFVGSGEVEWASLGSADG
jgi:hypothetical protein